MSTLDELDVRPEPGEGLVIRLPGLLAIIDTGSARSPEQVNELLEALRVVSGTTGTAPGMLLARQLSIWLTGIDQAPAFGTVAATDDGIAVFLHGNVSAQLDDADPISGREASFAVDRVLPWPATSLRLMIGDGASSDSMWSKLPAWAGLREGVALGAAVTARTSTEPEPAAADSQEADEPTLAEPVPAEAPTAQQPAVEQTPVPPASPLPPVPPTPPMPTPPQPAPPQPAAPAAEPAQPPRFFEQIHGAPAEAPRPPLPVAGATAPPSARERREEAKAGAAQRPGAYVRGFRCSRGHLNDPRVSFCGVCGIRMDHLTGILVYERRPPLGLLVMDAGTTFVLDDNYIIGRTPEVSSEVRDGSHRPIKIDDRSGSLSRVHSELRLVDWDVLMVDRGSANGTFVAGPDAATSPGGPRWTRLAPNQPFVLSPGTHVLIGRRTFVYESAAARL